MTTNNDFQQNNSDSTVNVPFTHQDLENNQLKQIKNSKVKYATGILAALVLGLGGIGIYKNAQFATNIDRSNAENPVTYPVTYPTPEFTDLSSVTNQYEAKFNFYFTASSSAYIVDVASNSAMLNSVKLISGTQSPLYLTNPKKYWSYYDCNNVFYWRVRTADNTIMQFVSPTQQATVNCIIPSPTPSVPPTQPPYTNPPSPSPTGVIDPLTPTPVPTKSAMPTKTPTPTATPSPTPVTVFGLNFEAEAGMIQTPFLIATQDNTKYIYQPGQSSTITQNGKAAYRFKVNSEATYIIRAVVKAPSAEANSFLVNIDSEPTSPKMIWDIKPTSSFTTRTVTWRNSGQAESNYTNAQKFKLSSGIHSLIIRGREPQTWLDKIIIEKK